MREFVNWHPVYASIDLKDATITVAGVTAKIGTGNLTFTEHNAMEYILDRGVLDDVRKGDEAPLDVRLDAVWEYIQSSTAGLADLEAAIKGTGGQTSSDTDACRPYACDIVITLDPTCGTPEVITLADFRWESMDHDLRAGTISTSGKCNVTRATKSYGSV